MRPGLAPRFETVAKCNAIFLKALFFGQTKEGKKMMFLQDYLMKTLLLWAILLATLLPSFVMTRVLQTLFIVECHKTMSSFKFVIAVGLKRTCRTDLGTGNDMSVVVKCGANLSGN